jgi:hypothetical protein
MALVESSVKNVIRDALGKCHEYKAQMVSWLLNGVVLFGLAIFGAFFYYYTFIRRASPAELHARMMKEQETVLSHIRHFQEERASAEITGLPMIGISGREE